MKSNYEVGSLEYLNPSSKEDFCRGVGDNLLSDPFVRRASGTIGHFDVVVDKKMGEHGLQLVSRIEPSGALAKVRHTYGIAKALNIIYHA